METKKNVAILGLKDSGYHSALCLAGRGYRVFASDLSKEEDVQKHAETLAAQGIDSEFGRHSFERILSQDWFLVSPGIPPSSEIYRKVQATGKPVHSEIEVASWFSKAEKVVAVTGSCGKTTTATLLARMIEASGRKAVLCGNIGNPWIGEISGIDDRTTVVVELSSFQLMHCSTFAPDHGLLLNIYPNHMDWHADMREYAEAKLNIFRRMKSTGTMICRKEDESGIFPDFKCSARRVYFDQREASNPNEAALLCAAEALGIPAKTVARTLADFQGLEHRLEKFLEMNGVSFVNDSKCTTPASLAWALEKYPDGKVVLVCGGKAKSRDFGGLKDIVARKVKCAVLIGASRPMIRESWTGATELAEADDFDRACDLAVQKAVSGDTVLLSPACASFDMFRDYRERGRLFREKIRERLETGAGI
jgi:UDP-N-acetylmuramoylalanine--D-glutamate ligase